MTTSGQIIGTYDYRLVALSVSIAILAAYAALDLAGRITTARGRMQMLWLGCGSIAMGLGIWAMHYIGMEAYNLPDAVDSLLRYDWPTTLLSLIAAILASAVALYLVSRPTMGWGRTILGSIMMGGGISAMHYIGMEAMRLPAMCVYSPRLVILSIVLAVIISGVALRLTFTFRDNSASRGWRRVVSGLLMGLAIPVQHYVGMAAVHFMPLNTYNGSMAYAVNPGNFDIIGITGVTLIVLALVFVTSMVNQRFVQQSRLKQDAELQLQTIFDQMKEGVVVIDRMRNIVQANRTAVDLLGLPGNGDDRENISSEFELFLLDGTPLPADRWPAKLALEQGEFLNNQAIKIVRKDTGKSIFAEISTAPVHNSAGEMTQIIVSYRDISARLQVEEARSQLIEQAQQFKESSLQLQTVFDNMTEAIVVVDKGHNIVHLNQAASEFLGLKVEALAFPQLESTFEASTADGKPLTPEDWPGMRALRGEPLPNFEIVVRRKDTGKIITAETNTSVIRDAAGEIFQVIISLRDISVRKQRDEVRALLDIKSQQYEESSLQLQTVFDNMSEAIVVMDAELNILEHNNAAIQLLGNRDSIHSIKDLVQNYDVLSPTGSLLKPDEWPISRAIRGDFRKDVEVFIRRKDTGTILNVEISTVPLEVAGGVPKVIASFRDISERKQMDEAKTRLVSIVQSSEDAIIGKNDHGIVTDWNLGAEKIFGYTSAEMIGQSIKILLPTGHEHEEEDILARIKRGETVDHIECIRRRKDGTLINVSLSISPIRDGWGKIIGASKIARDITEKRLLERQLHQSQKMEAIGQLTGGIAHDFNNLLGVVIGNLDLLEGLVPSNEDALKRVRTAQKGALRGADLTRRLLAFSSNEELRPKVVKLSHCIRNMIELSARAIGPEITITTEFDENVPTVFVDAAGLESALLNLVVNARDAMPRGGTIHVTTAVYNLEPSYAPVRAGELKPGRYACVAVSDNGQGMSRETVERAFEPFFTTKPRGKGTGLGLAMVYGFVKQSGGTVRIYSEPGYGTTVSFYLPLAEGMAQPASLPSAMPSLKASGTVLVVDDETDLLEIASTYLTEMGYTALQAKDGLTALEILEHHEDVDLVMTDIVMPGGMNGVELAQKIRQIRPEIKIVYSSGFPANALAERSMPLVDGPLLHKPYQRTDFSAMIRRVMEGQTIE